jgi:histone H4
MTQFITKNAIKRLAHKAGVKNMSSLIYEEVRGRMLEHVNHLVNDTLKFTEHERRIRVLTADVQLALQGLGRVPYHRNCTQVSVKLHGNELPQHQRRVVSSCDRQPPKLCASNRPDYPLQRHQAKGNRAIQSIRKYQKQGNCFVFPKASFRQMVRTIAKDIHFLNYFLSHDRPRITGEYIPVQFSPEAMDMLQTDTEYYFINLLMKTNEAAIHANRVTIMPKDIQIAQYMAR